MEDVSVEMISETGVSTSNRELIDKEKKGSMNQGNELTNTDSLTTSQNGKADESDPSEEKKKGDTEKSISGDEVLLSENDLSTLPAESRKRDSVSCGGTLHHTDTAFLAREHSIPDANQSDSSKKRSRKRGKKKKNSSCEEKMLDDAEKTTNEEQVDPSKDTLSYSIIQEGSHEHIQDSSEKPGAAQLCSGPNFSTLEDSRSDATMTTCSQKKRGRDMLKENGVDIHSTNAEVTEKSNTILEAEGSKSTRIEAKTVASVVINSCPEDKDNIVEQREGTSVKLNETEKSNSGDEILLSENYLSPLPAKSCKRDSVSCEEPGATLHHTDPLFSTGEDSMPDANRNDSSRKKLKKRGKKEKNSKMLDDAEKNTNEEQVHPPKNTLSYSIIQEGSREHILDSCEKPGTAQLCTGLNMSTLEDSGPAATMMTCSQKRKRKGKRVENLLKESGVNIHSTNAEVSEKSNTIFEAEGSKSRSIEEKTVASVVINSCVTAKDNTVEQREGTSVKLNETVSQTQSPKAKKRKKKKTKTMEVCEPLGNALATSMQNRPVECLENNDDNAGRELMSNLASQRDNSAIMEESGFQNLAKTKEKETDENTKVGEDVLGAGLCDDVRGKKQKKTSSADHKTADMVGEDTTSKTEKSATTEKSVVQNPRKRKERPEDANVESNQDALGAEGVKDVGRKKKKRKRNKNKNCESVANMDSESVQCLSCHSNREAVENSDGNADREIASKDLASKIEDSATEGKSVENVENTQKEKEYTKGEDDQDALGAEGVIKVEVKTKKKKKKSKKMKKLLECNAANMEEKKDDVSVRRDDEEPEVDREKLEISLSSFDLGHNNVTEGVASPETGDLPRCSCEGQRTKTLVVFDLNGILADIVQGDTDEFVPDGKISSRSVFRRPYVARFLDVCFEKFEVGIWSSRRIGLDYMINVVMRNHARNLLFCFDQNICITTNFKTQEDRRKPVFLKDLRRVWNRFGTCLTCGKRKYDETNTLLVDDSPHKALCNPPHTGIFPSPYQYTDLEDSSLGPNGELRKYLTRLADAENVQKFVEENPFGQAAITETHKSWEYYSKIIEAYK